MTRIERLEAARDRLEGAMLTVDDDKVSTVVREYRAVLAELAELKPEATSAEPAKGSVDEVAARRKSRKPDPEGSGSSQVQ